MLDQNTDRMWYVIGAIVIGAAIIAMGLNIYSESFASVDDSFSDYMMYSISSVDIDPVTESDIITESLVLNYDFKDGTRTDTGISDSSGVSGSGLLKDFTDESGGWRDDGLHFTNGVNQVVGPSDMIFKDEVMTMEARVKFHDLDYDNRLGALNSIIKKGHVDAIVPHKGFAMTYDNRHNRMNFNYTNVGNSSGGFGGGGNRFRGNHKLNQDDWVTITVTVDEDMVGRLYLDGRLRRESQFENVQLNNNSPMIIGRWFGAYAKSDMTIQSVRIYDRPLDEREVAQNHNYDQLRRE